MKRFGRRGFVAIAVLLVAALVAGVSACGDDDDDGGQGGGGNRFEFFSWWTGGGDSEGIAGGAGTNAQAELANRLLADDPPDSYQRHAGAELLEDIEAGEVEDLTFLYEEEGWRDVFPQRLLDLITVDDKIYSVPVDIQPLYPSRV